MKQVTIIDYGLSNILSIRRAVENIGYKVEISENSETISNAELLILPGVGSFHDGMKELNKRNIPDAIIYYLKKGNPFLGICLGMQMMLNKGFEVKETLGLGLIDGEVTKLPAKDKDGTIKKIPHIGWNRISYFEDEKQISDLKMAYFVHSYYAKVKSKLNIMATTDYGDFSFASVISNQNAVGVQFHPEKSGQSGLNFLEKILKN